MDLRLKNLSYSGLLTLHTCPRLFQLEKLNAEVEASEDFEASVTFAFGHVVGLGIQLHFEGYSEDQIIWRLFQFWEPDLLVSNEKQKKSFWLALGAIRNFLSLRANGFLSEWELVYHESKPATELSFAVNIPGGFRYRGFVDAVLQNKITGAIMVLEVKTTSATNLNPASYKNSAQAVGYSVVLDHLFPDLSAYEVLYLVYSTKSLEYTPLPFPKSYLQRALWIQEILLDVEMIKMYEEKQVYPMHGESCIQYYMECKYLQTCTMSTSLLTSDLTEEGEQKLIEKEAEYQINVSIADLIQAQLRKEI